MSTQAVAYVRSLQLADRNAEIVFLLLAERTKVPAWEDDEPEVMGLDLQDADISELAARAAVSPSEFKRLLRALRDIVPMDVLDHGDLGWEIVYGPAYTKPASRPRQAAEERKIGRVESFTMPGWDHYSTWGYEDGLGHFYAQLYLNSDDRDGRPRIWITPPSYVPTSVDELAEAVATTIAVYEAVPPPAVAIKAWLLRGLEWRGP